MSRARAPHLARKATELVARELGVATDLRQARRLAASEEGPPPPAGTAGPRPRVLVLSPRDWAAHLHWEALLARGLRRRGAEVTVATCGGGLEICDRVNVHEGPPMPCHTCGRYATAVWRAHGHAPVGLTPLAHGDPWPELDALTLPELGGVEHDGLPLGRLVEVPVRWFLCRSDLSEEPLAAPVTRAFLRSARRLADATARVLDRVRPDVLLCLNGLFLFEAVAAALARRRGVDVVTYERAHVDGRLFFSRVGPACHYDVSALWPTARGRPLTADEEDRLDRYLTDRRHGRRSFAPVWTTPRFSAPPPPPGRKRVVVFTNVTWDSAALGLDVAWPHMAAWLADCLGRLAHRPGIELVVRAHPSETQLPLWRSRELTTELVARFLGRERAPDVVVVPPEDPTSSYALLEQAAAVLVYTSTIGLEAALAGVPVIVAGRPHYAGKGFTLDLTARSELGPLVEEVLADPDAYRPDENQARRYANLFFFEATVTRPPAAEPVPGLARLEVTDATTLAAHVDLDRCCAGILGGSAHPGATVEVVRGGSR